MSLLQVNLTYVKHNQTTKNRSLKNKLRYNLLLKSIAKLTLTSL